MRTIVIIQGGLLLHGVALLLARWIGAGTQMMVRFLAFVALILVVACASNSGNRSDVTQMNGDFAAALNRRDTAAAANLYFPEATLLPPNEPIVRGRANIQVYWQGALDADVSDVSVTTIDSGTRGDLGYEVGRYQLSIRQSNGSSVRETGKYIELLRRDTDGKWRSTYGIWNSDAPAPSAQ
jgi:ketosteroid isomerase-like protein